MSYDSNVPEQLKTIQTWFAGVITHPIDHKSRIAHLSPSGNPIEKEAAEFIKPSPTLKPEQRIEIYNQQYWWRLLNVLQSTFTMTTRMLGFRKFNDHIAVPYLEAYPSEHYSVSHIGDHLLDWMRQHYKGEDKVLLTDALSIDYAMHAAFFEANYTSITENLSPEQAFATEAFLQPHTTLFKLDCHLFEFRNKIQTKDPDYWSSHHFPNLEHALSEDNGHFPNLKRDRIYCFIVYRSRMNRVKWLEISMAEHALLSLFQDGKSIEQACEWLAEGGSEYLEEATPNLQEWIQGWVAKQLLYSPKQLG